MNNDTIKAAGSILTEYEVIIAQKDKQTKELVEALEHSNMVINSWCDTNSQIFKNKQLIQKHRS